jgi:hypothetical protein
MTKIERGDESRSVIVHVARTAMESRELVAKETKLAKRTMGRSQVATILDQDDPASEIRCSTSGWTPFR